jgi:uncharacterized membrane protein YoaK (UPF0700 family)
VLLTFGSGVTDAFAFLGLGGTFTANMTGNLVLVGLVGRPDYPRAALLAGVAIAAFALSLLVSFRVFRNVADWRLVCTVLLSICAGLQVLTWLGWLSTGGAPGTPMMVAAVVFSACAMGAQTAAARRTTANAGISTTFVTGTLTALLQDAADGRRRSDRWVRVAAIGSLVLGALVGSVGLQTQPLFVPVIPAVAALVALALIRSAVRPP